MIHHFPKLSMRRLFVSIACVLFAPLSGAAEEPAPRAMKSFDILEYRIEGNTVLPALAVERAVYPHLGPGRGIADAERAREALERAYQDAGYLTVVVEIPEQKVEEGVVTLRVGEGKVERLKVSGNRYTSRGQIRAQTPSLAAGEVPQFAEVQKELGQLSRTADRRVTPLLRPGRAPGRVEVELKVDDSLPLHAGIELNSKQTQDTSRGRLEAYARYDNLWQRGHSLRVDYVTAPRQRNDVELLGVNYVAPLGDGKSLSFWGIRSDSNVTTTLDSTVVGKGAILGLRLGLALPSRGGYAHSFLVGVDYKDLDETTTLLGVDTTNRPLRYAPLAANYLGALQDAGGRWQLRADALVSLRGLADRTVDCGGVTMDQFACRRTGARSNFAVFRGEVQRTRVLPAGWDLLAQLGVQYASQPLVSSEQFAAGGLDTVRGYLESERLGDDGARARLELRTPSFWPAAAGPVEGRGLVFYDHAWLRLQEPLPGQEGRFSLASGGAGLRLKSGHWRLNLDLARALRSGAAGETKEGAKRLDLSLAYEF